MARLASVTRDQQGLTSMNLYGWMPRASQFTLAVQHHEDRRTAGDVQVHTFAAFVRASSMV